MEQVLSQIGEPATEHRLCELVRRGGSENTPISLKKQNDLCVQEIVEEIRHKMQVSAGFQAALQELQVRHSEKPPPTVLVFGPGIGEVKVESVDGGFS